MRSLFAEPDFDSNLGRMLYALYSAVSHGTLFGLRTSVQALADDDPRSDGWALDNRQVLAAVAVGVDSVIAILAAVTHGYLTASEQYMALMGWETEDRRRNATNALRVVHRAVVAGRG